MFEKLKKKVAAALRTEPKLDTAERVKFQYGALTVRVGSSLTIRSNNGLIYGSVCGKPSSNIVSHISTIMLGRSKVCRCYFDKEYFLQIIVDYKNDIEECRLYKLVQVVEPSTREEWAEYLLNYRDAANIGSHPGIIGRDEVIHDNNSYLRLESWASPESAWVEPAKFQEQRYGLDNVLETVSHEAMAYGRWLNEDNEIAEYLIISSEELDFSNNTAYNTQKECAIRYYVGIDISFDDIISNF